MKLLSYRRSAVLRAAIAWEVSLGCLVAPQVSIRPMAGQATGAKSWFAKRETMGPMEEKKGLVSPTRWPRGISFVSSSLETKAENGQR
jgi:hypothetical protein